MSGARGPAVGTAFHPETDSVLNGAGRPASQPIALARLPRRRRPGMIALAVALVGAGILASTAVYSATNHRVPVLVAQASVPAGALISASDVGTASVSVGPGVQVIPASQLKQVVGQVAGTALHPGMLLTAAELATQRPPAPGWVLVPLPVRPSGLPASGLQPGDHVLVVATPGAEPTAEGGYGAALLLDGSAMLSRPDLRAAEEALRRWMAAAALVRPASAGGRVVIAVVSTVLLVLAGTLVLRRK